MKAHIVATIAACLAIAAAPAIAQEPCAAQLALANLPAASGASLEVTSPAFKAGDDIPFENTQYRGNTFPGLSWTRGPAGTKSYAIIMQDPDSLFRGAPILHWTMFNIPPGVTKLEPGMTAPPPGPATAPTSAGRTTPTWGPTRRRAPSVTTTCRSSPWTPSSPLTPAPPTTP
jgi:hypothetical protein